MDNYEIITHPNILCIRRKLLEILNELSREKKRKKTKKKGRLYYGLLYRYYTLIIKYKNFHTKCKAYKMLVPFKIENELFTFENGMKVPIQPSTWTLVEIHREMLR